ncbi:putative riboflavin kinase [Drosophila guanche]|uniref:Riboflavin kinase n=1 Tax=Drosophila guanche TaxID=7266 RepID=A0A3B0JPJ2_DROGU|nr:putative riboflavin kinase [Drosophila guanche]SPP84055.1 blast:Putative riboflavin kinase [Drosophila guanche]
MRLYFAGLNKFSCNVIHTQWKPTISNCIFLNRSSARNLSKTRKTFKRHHNTTSNGQINQMLNQLPLYASGEIVRGFGRGSKELGIPTANFPLEVVKSLPESLLTGVYYGWANVDNGSVHKMVLSVGWNPFYNNTEKSVETHMLHEFNCDLYGQLLKICIVGYLRPEKSFDSLEALIAAIKVDIEQAKTHLDTPENKKLQEATFFAKKPSDCECK